MNDKKKEVVAIVSLILLGMTVYVVMICFVFQESPEDAYKRGKIDGQLSDSTVPYVTMEIASPSEIVKQIIDDDTLYFWRQKVDTGYVLTPVYRMRKSWVLQSDSSTWYDGVAPDSTWKEWLDTSRGWYSWDISADLAQGWYDRAADTSHSVYEKAAYAWAMSYLLRTRTFVIYFDSTDTIPVMEMEGVEVDYFPDTMPAVEWNRLPIILPDTGSER